MDNEPFKLFMPVPELSDVEKRRSDKIWRLKNALSLLGRAMRYIPAGLKLPPLGQMDRNQKRTFESALATALRAVAT